MVLLKCGVKHDQKNQKSLLSLSVNVSNYYDDIKKKISQMWITQSVGNNYCELTCNPGEEDIRFCGDMVA